MREQKAFLATTLVLLLLGMGTWGCRPAQTPTPTPTFTPQPTLALPLSRYEGERVSMMYPAGWGRIEEQSDRLTIFEPSGCGFIRISWDEAESEIGETAEDRYRKAREMVYRIILEQHENEPEFEILREYRFGDAPIFEYQYWVEERACMANVRLMTYTDLEIRKSVTAAWPLSNCCGTDEWYQEMGFRRALFDTVMQSITFK